MHFAKLNLILYFVKEWLLTMIKTVPIKSNKEFIRVYKKGKFYVGKFIVLYVLSNNLRINRIGIGVSRKFGKSVKRNRVKRLIRENYRFYEEFVRDGYDLIFSVRHSAELPVFSEIKKETKFLLKKLEIFDQEKWDCLKGC